MSSEFFFRNNATGTRITAKGMVDYNAIQKLLTKENLHFFTFYTKADKPVKAVIRHLLDNTTADDITVDLQKTDYDISVKQMTAKRPTPEGGVTYTFLPPLPSYSSKESKSSRNLQIGILYNTVIKVQTYRF
jgi:hypothetical protein